MKQQHYEKIHVFSERWLSVFDTLVLKNKNLIYLGYADGYLIFGEGLIDDKIKTA